MFDDGDAGWPNSSPVVYLNFLIGYAFFLFELILNLLNKNSWSFSWGSDCQSCDEEGEKCSHHQTCENVRFCERNIWLNFGTIQFGISQEPSEKSEADQGWTSQTNTSADDSCCLTGLVQARSCISLLLSQVGHFNWCEGAQSEGT